MVCFESAAPGGLGLERERLALGGKAHDRMEPGDLAVAFAGLQMDSKASSGFVLLEALAWGQWQAS